MSKKNIFAALCAGIICMTMSVPIYATDNKNYQIDYNRENCTINISGEPKSLTEGEFVSFVLLKPDTDVSKIGDSDVKFSDVGVDAGDTCVENGKFVFDEIKLSSTLEPGEYILIISEKGTSEEIIIGIASEEQAVELIKEASSAEKVISLMESFNDVYGLDIGKDSIYIENGAEMKDFVGEYIADSDPETIEELNEAFEQASCLYRIYLGPWTGVKEVIEEYADVLGLSLSDLNDADNKTDVYKKLAGNLYDSTSELEDAFEDAIKASKKKSSSASSSGGGGGGGARPVITTPYTPVTTTAPMLVPTVSPESTEVPVSDDTKVFTDIDAYGWAEDSIIKLYNAGIISGKQAGIFAPADNVTRAEAVKMLSLTFKFDDADEPVIFDDVPADDWAYVYVAAAAKTGVVKGYSDTVFGKNDNITRQDLAVIIYRAALNEGIEFDSTNTDFSDYEEVADYAKEAVAALAGKGVVNGIDGAFVPSGFATRAEIAKILAGFLD